MLEGRRAAAADRPAVTNVVTERSNVRITGTQRQLAAESEREPQELAEECARLRRDNRRLEADVERLRAEVSRLTASGAQPREAARDAREVDLDDSARRFSLLELDL